MKACVSTWGMIECIKSPFNCFFILFYNLPRTVFCNSSFLSCKERPIRWMAPDLYHDAVLNHACYNLTPSMGKVVVFVWPSFRICFISYRVEFLFSRISTPSWFVWVEKEIWRLHHRFLVKLKIYLRHLSRISYKLQKFWCKLLNTALKFWHLRKVCMCLLNILITFAFEKLQHALCLNAHSDTSRLSNPNQSSHHFSFSIYDLFTVILFSNTRKKNQTSEILIKVFEFSFADSLQYFWDVLLLQHKKNPTKSQF